MKYFNRTAVVSLSLSLGLVCASVANAGPIDPNFEELENNPIAEFRGNGDNTSWSFGTGKDTQQTGSFDNSGYQWQSNVATPWSFSVSGNTATLTVDDVVTQYTGLMPDQLAANTLAIHAKDNVAFTYDFLGIGSGSLQGSTASGERFAFDWAYLGLESGLSGISASGTITFLDEVIARQSGTGVSFKIGNVAEVPEPGTLALFGLGLLGMGVARRRKA